MKSFLKTSWPRAIIHVDGDSFFVSCEVAMDPSLRGKPVITGHERGIASAMSMEAKRAGITRGMPVYKARRICPNLVVLPGDYETYAMFSHRMYEIVRRYTVDVEEYSIDECFADITGLQRPFNMNYVEIARNIKHDLDTELGITFSLGLAPTKTLAKVGSKWKKPNGFTIIPGRDIYNFLERLPIESVWGIGLRTGSYLRKCGIRTALDFAKRDELWVKHSLTKPFREKWLDLRGVVANEIDSTPKASQKSISKTRTFTPPSRDKNFILARLSQNIENACYKARRFGLSPGKVLFFFKTEEFKYHTLEVKLSQPTANPSELMSIAQERVREFFDVKKLYRATGVVLLNLEGSSIAQADLFGYSKKLEMVSHVFKSVDELSDKYGKHIVRLASSIQNHFVSREQFSSRQPVLPGTKNKHLPIPFLGKVV